MDEMPEISNDQRALLGRLVEDRRPKRFRSVKGALEAAMVSHPTWYKVTSGKRVSPDTVAAIVSVLWPKTQGQWWRTPGMTGPHADPIPDDPSSSEVEELRERIARLEQAVFGRPAVSLRAASDQLADETGHSGEDLATEEGDAP